MARHREFDPDEAMIKIMQLFWSKGFEATSYDDLVATTGVSRKSLYSTFGDKRTMYEGALETYRTTIIPQVTEPLVKNAQNTERLALAFEKFGERIAEGRLSNGCFLLNAATNAMADDPFAQDAFNDYLETFREQLFERFEQAGRNENAATELSRFIVGAVQALAVLARGNSKPALINGFVSVSAQAIRTSK